MVKDIKTTLVDFVHYMGTFKFWKELVIMTLGMAVTAAAVYYFLVPSKLIIGTISGLSIVLSNIFGGNLGTWIMGINILLLILAFLLIGNEFGAKTVYTALILGPLTNFWDWVFPWQNVANANPVTGTPSVMGDPWFDLCCFVLLLSAAQALMFSINASTGGLDILAKIVNKYLHFDIGTSVSIAGAMICCTAFFINPFRMVIIGLIGTWINGLVVDYFTAALGNRKRVCIVSKEHERIRKYIVDNLHRGCTLYEVVGGYSGEKSIELEVLLGKDEFSQLLAWLKQEQISAFTTANNVSEVYGLWFSTKKRKQLEEEMKRR
ncbi:MAG: YitT family protein [Bacteroidales bacterium]|nr:YitT family protein [Bacteroidales bacterium]MBR4199615.1 YitT family protein [Bacteroidales bacterium]